MFEVSFKERKTQSTFQVTPIIILFLNYVQSEYKRKKWKISRRLFICRSFNFEERTHHVHSFPIWNYLQIFYTFFNQKIFQTHLVTLVCEKSFANLFKIEIVIVSIKIYKRSKNTPSMEHFEPMNHKTQVVGLFHLQYNERRN